MSQKRAVPENLMHILMTLTATGNVIPTAHIQLATDKTSLTNLWIDYMKTRYITPC